MEFFESLGFACPERKGIADFLQEVTSRKDQKVSVHLPPHFAVAYAKPILFLPLRVHQKGIVLGQHASH